MPEQMVVFVYLALQALCLLEEREWSEVFRYSFLTFLPAQYPFLVLRGREARMAQPEEGGGMRKREGITNPLWVRCVISKVIAFL
jgi:hypothetical protein